MRGENALQRNNMRTYTPKNTTYTMHHPLLAGLAKHKDTAQSGMTESMSTVVS